MAKLKLTQTRSQIGQSERHRGTLRALGLGKIGKTNELDDGPVEDVRRFEAEFLQYVNDNAKGVLPGIRESKKLSDDALTTLKGAISEFKKGFTTGAGTLLGSEEEVEALDQDQVEQETIARVKKA